MGSDSQVGAAAGTALDGSGQASVDTSLLSVGTHRSIACYHGTAIQAASVASGSYVINKATTSTALTFSPASPQPFGTDVTFTATVKVGTAALTTGSVKFYDDGGRNGGV